jgi:hypothetical protein
MEPIGKIIKRLEKQEHDPLQLDTSVAAVPSAEILTLEVAGKQTTKRKKSTPAKRRGSTKLESSREKGSARDHVAEAAVSQASLFEHMLAYRTQRQEREAGQLVQIAQSLILCGLPYRATDATEFSRTSRAGDGSLIRVTFYGLGKDEEGKPIPMAYGSDRTYLHWAVDKAIKLKSPFIPLGTGIEYMKDVGQLPTGPNYKRLRDAHRRLSSLAIVVERHSHGDERRAILPIIAQSYLPHSIVPGTLPIAGRAGIRFSDDFFKEITARHVPFPWEILKSLQAKPQMQDYILFLHWRSFAGRSDTVISWDQLRTQLWQEDTNPWRIRARFQAAIKMLKVAWPELNAAACSGGLRIGPPKGGKHLLTAHSAEIKR